MCSRDEYFVKCNVEKSNWVVQSTVAYVSLGLALSVKHRVWHYLYGDVAEYKYIHRIGGHRISFKKIQRCKREKEFQSTKEK